MNQDTLDEQLGNDESFKDFVLNLVIKELEKSYNELHQITLVGDTEQAKTLLHKLKGISGTTGLVKLNEVVTFWEVNLNQNVDFNHLSEVVGKEIKTGIEIFKKLNKK